MYKYSSQLNGSLEDIEILEIASSRHPVRSNIINIDELAKSIKKFGLLQPIVVRTSSLYNFEVIAGNRRLNACKKIGWRKITCHVVEMDDKTAFEVSIIENLQRHTLNPIEEGIAFRKYVDELGWGGVSELAEKLSKSASYICKRIKLTELPKSMIDLISNSEMNVSSAEELLSLEDKNIQSELTKLIQYRQLSTRTVRKLVKKLETQNSDKAFRYITTSTNEYEKIQKTIDKIIILLKILIKKFATVIEDVEDKWIFYELLMQHKHAIDQQIDLLLREKRKFKKYSHKLVNYHSESE